MLQHNAIKLIYQQSTTTLELSEAVTSLLALEDQH